MAIVETIYQLPIIQYSKLRFQLVSREEAFLPESKGSILRGAFGHALRKTVCALGSQAKCVSCMLRQQCAYTRLFETFISGHPPRFLRGLDTAPRPIIFRCRNTERHYPPGSEFSFELSLIGSAIEFLPFVVFSVLQMAQSGFGVRRHLFELTGVDCLQSLPETQEIFWEKLYDAPSQSLTFSPKPLPIPRLHLSDDIHLHFVTPTRLQFDGKYQLDFNFRNLGFKILRRVLELAWFYMPGSDINWEFHDLLVAADKVKIVERNLRWADWQRYSNRQKTKINMGGFIGDLRLEGELAPFVDLLSYAAVLHVGKGTVFGLGEVRVSGA